MLKLIKDIGLVANEKGRKEYFCLYECPVCGIQFESRKYDVERRKSSSCFKCRNITHGKTRTKLHTVWQQMKIRVNKDYKDKKISVCEKWINSYEEFERWSKSNGYQEGLSIDRIDNSKGYSPNNCRWTTREVQAQNTRLICSRNTIGYRGVERSGKKFVARICSNGKRIGLGTYTTAEDAAKAYNSYVIENNTNHPLNQLPKLVKETK